MPTGATTNTPPLVSGSILWNLFLFVSWVLVMTTLAFHGALGTALWSAGADPDFISVPSWFAWTWLYLAALPASIAAIVWGRKHHNNNALIASMVVPAIPVSIALLGFAQA